MGEPVVLLDRPVPHVARLLINRPDKRNAIDFDVRQLMTEHLSALIDDTDVRAVILGGTQGVLSAGGDLASMAGLNDAQARDRMRHIHALCRLVAGVRMPVVTAMEGIAAGAAVGLALLGDRIVAGPGTKILFPFHKLGLTPDWGQLLTLPRRVGLPAARRLLSDGRTLDGDEACRIGLADLVVPDAEVMATAVKLAEELAKLPAEAFARMKQRLNHPSPSLAAELAREEDDQAVCLLSDAFAEGFDAFQAKRPADFIHPARRPS